jgi:hypothetical protein
MSRPNGDLRPAVLSRDLFDRLNVLRAFRHRERNIYGFNLNAERVKEIAASVPETLGGFKFRSEHHLCSESRRGGCNGNDGS